jgi:hypothetical protein
LFVCSFVFCDEGPVLAARAKKQEGSKTRVVYGTVPVRRTVDL